MDVIFPFYFFFVFVLAVLLPRLALSDEIVFGTSGSGAVSVLVLNIVAPQLSADVHTGPDFLIAPERGGGLVRGGSIGPLRASCIL